MPVPDNWKTAALLRDRTRRVIRERFKAGESAVSLADDFEVPVEFIEWICERQLFGDDRVEQSGR